MATDNVELLRLGRRIQAERKILGFSQNGFAKDCGLNRSYFGGIERGERNLTFAFCSGKVRFRSRRSGLRIRGVRAGDDGCLAFGQRAVQIKNDELFQKLMRPPVVKFPAS